MEERKIKANAGYRITGSMPGQPPRIAYVSKRRGNLITLMLVNGIVTSTVTPARVFGSEYAQVKTPFGVYNLSPCGEIKDIDGVAEVCDVIRQCPD